ncbi:hypothetical protein GCM10010317_008310 [Streptomyces mirabilis]|nr:hypothetical protein GCM10010317_008310 [Streptomyces mirabilis]
MGGPGPVLLLGEEWEQLTRLGEAEGSRSGPRTAWPTTPAGASECGGAAVGGHRMPARFGPSGDADWSARDTASRAVLPRPCRHIPVCPATPM